MEKISQISALIYSKACKVDPLLTNLDKFLARHCIEYIINGSGLDLNSIDEKTIKAFIIGIQGELENNKSKEIEENINWECFPEWYQVLYNTLDEISKREQPEIICEVYLRLWMKLAKNAVAVFAHLAKEFVKFIQEEKEFRDATTSFHQHSTTSTESNRYRVYFEDAKFKND